MLPSGGAHTLSSLFGASSRRIREPRCTFENRRGSASTLDKRNDVVAANHGDHRMQEPNCMCVPVLMEITSECVSFLRCPLWYVADGARQ